MKTPEEIKKAVSLCILCERCTDCPYCESESEAGCMSALNTDALAYIEQLEAENAPGNKMPVFITTPKGVSINVNRIDGVCVSPDGNLDIFVGGAGDPFTLKGEDKDVFLTALQKCQHPCDERLEAEREGKSDE